MYKKILISLLFYLVTIQLFAQDRTADRQELQNLLNERKQKFDSYTNSLEKRSGIFGGKTKNDVLRSNEVLSEIVRTDNRIINTLNRVADFKTFEKVNMNYDLMKSNEQLANLRHAVDTLNGQIKALKFLNESLKNKTSGFGWLTYGLMSLIGILLILLLRKKIYSNE
ncbi:MAG: hypothetical protein JJE25_09025 [Bacteroidia bacterium]|nr:hypothetical protein [Bacteroidia bacterium]